MRILIFMRCCLNFRLNVIKEIIIEKIPESDAQPIAELLQLQK